MTGGRLYTDGSLAFRNVSVDLFGPEFVWFTSYFSNFMSFLGDPDPTLPHALGTDVEFDASITADGEFFENAEFPVGLLIFQGQDYLATGQIQVDTEPIPVGLGVVTVPFTLVGSVHGCTATGLESCGRGSETVDLSILASGTVHALFNEVPGDDGLLQLAVIQYEVEAPVPEPTSLLLMAGGVAALAARVRLRR